MNSDKIPIEKVLDDMNSPNGGVASWAARDYYYTYYATPEERKRMDRKDQNDAIAAIIFSVCFMVFIVLAILSQM